MTQYGNGNLQFIIVVVIKRRAGMNLKPSRRQQEPLCSGASIGHRCQLMVHVSNLTQSPNHKTFLGYYNDHSQPTSQHGNSRCLMGVPICPCRLLVVPEAKRRRLSSPALYGSSTNTVFSAYLHMTQTHTADMFDILHHLPLVWLLPPGPTPHLSPPATFTGSRI